VTTGPTALILDFGGVLTTNLMDVFRDFARRAGLPDDAMVETSTTNPDGVRLWHALERGDIDQAAFDRGLAALLGIKSDRLLGRPADLLRPDQPMLDLLADLRGRGVKTACCRTRGAAATSTPTPPGSSTPAPTSSSCPTRGGEVGGVVGVVPRGVRVDSASSTTSCTPDRPRARTRRISSSRLPPSDRSLTSTITVLVTRAR
jgi:hypothetical protein